MSFGLKKKMNHSLHRLFICQILYSDWQIKKNIYISKSMIGGNYYNKLAI